MRTTNEQKAKHLASREMYGGFTLAEQNAAYQAAMEAMEWKDEQFEEEKKEIDEQWKRLMAESKSIGVDLLQCKDEQYKKEKQQLIDKAAEWLRMTMDFFNNGEFNTEQFVNDFKQTMKGE